MPSITPFMMDGGHNQIKTCAPTGAVVEDAFPHLFATLDSGDYQRIISRADADTEDYFIVNGTAYVIGERAQRYNPYDRMEGEQRYQESYYGVLAAIAMTRAFRKSRRNIFFVGSHPPGDADYRDDLMAAVVRKWMVEWRDQRFEFEVVDANTLDEPLGGYHNAILRKDGMGYQNRAIERRTTLVLDIGAFTTDGILIDPGGKIDYATAESVEIGVHSTVRQFMKDFRTANRRLLVGNDLDEQMAQEAMRTGAFDLRGLGQFDVQRQVQEFRNMLVAQVVKFIARYGGAARYDTLLLTGGGSALLETELRDRIRHNNIQPADKSIGSLHMANVRGLRKWFLMHQAMGTFAK